MSRLLNTFSSASLHSNDLRTRVDEENMKAGNPLAQSQGAMTENLTILTQASDDYNVNPNNFAKLDAEVREHKVGSIVCVALDNRLW